MISLLLTLSFLAQQSEPVVRLTETTPAERAELRARTEPSDEGEWRALSNLVNPAVALDITHVEREGDLRTFWIARTGGMDEITPGAYMVVRMQIDCEARSARPLWMAVRAPSGTNIFGQAAHDEFVSYEGQSGGAGIAAVVCEGVTPTGLSFATHQAFAAAVATP